MPPRPAPSAAARTLGGCVLAAAVASACSAPPAPTLRGTAAPGALGQALDRARARHGAVLLLARGSQIIALTPTLEQVATIAERGGRELQVIDHVLYALDQRALYAIDLRTGQQRKVVALPALHHACFSDPDPGVYVEQGTVPRIDPERGVMCMRIQDRNDNMMNIAIEYRIDLRTGAVVQRTAYASDECAEPGEPKEAASPCDLPEPASAPAPARPRDTAPHSLAEIDSPYGDISASGRWALFHHGALGAEGDYIYTAPLLFDGTTGQTYAITPAGPVAFDLAAAVRDAHAPDGTCMTPAEWPAAWITGTDLLTIPGCGDGALVVRPPSTVVGSLPGYDYVVY